MSPDAFRSLALALPDVVEGAHMGHADFRLGGKIFATLGSPDDDHAMVNLDPEQQEMLMAAEPAAFTPASGAWGRNGSTRLRLAAADVLTARSALAMAHARMAARLAAPKTRRR